MSLGRIAQKRHRWNADNHTNTTTVCLDCGLERRALVVRKPGTEGPGEGVTQYRIAGRWRARRVAECVPIDVGIGRTAATSVDDLETLDSWVMNHEGCSHKTIGSACVLAIPGGFSKHFAGHSPTEARRAAAQHIRRILRKRAEREASAEFVGDATG